jgi:AAA domain-containing protein
VAPKLDDPRYLSALEESIEKHKPVVVFIDPTYLAMGGAETTNVFSMGERLGNLTRLCTKKGITPVLLHHLRGSRANSFTQATLDELTMAGFSEWAGQWILLSRREKYDPDDPLFRLWINFGGREITPSAWGIDIFEGKNEDKGGKVWDTELMRQDEIRGAKTRKKTEKQEAENQEKQVKLETYCKKVLDFIKKRPEGVTKQNVKESGHCPVGKAAAVLFRLEDDGAIEPCKVGRPNRSGITQRDGYKVVCSDRKNLFESQPVQPVR